MINFKGKKQYFENKIRCLIRQEEIYDEDNEEEIDDIKRKLEALYFEERASYSDDLVQPGDPRFQTLYKKEWLKKEKEKEEAHLKAKRIKAEREQFYKDNILEGKSKVMNALKLEDKIRHA